MSLDLKSIPNNPTLFSPNYEQNISMVVPTAFRCLDQNLGRHSFFDDPQTKRILEDNLCRDVENVIVLLVDSLGFKQFKTMSKRLFNVYQKLNCFPISSTCPTITSTCLMSIHTGLSPCGHGILGHKIFVPQYDTIIDFLKMSPIDVKIRDSLMKSGINYRRIVSWSPSLYNLMDQDMIAHVGLVHYRILGTGLSNLLVDPQNRTDIGYANLIDLFTKAKKILKNKKKLPQPKMLLNLYTGYLDELSHLYGPNSQEYLTGFYHFESRFLEFIESLEKEGLGEKTTIFLFSDHGQVPLDPNKILTFSKSEIEYITPFFSVSPGRSGRTIHIYVKPEFLEDAEAFFIDFIGDKGAVFKFSDVVDFLGCPSSLPPNLKQLRKRFGNLVIFLKKGYHLEFPKPKKEKDLIDRLVEPNVKLGSHGSLTFDELVVPCIASNVSKIASLSHLSSSARPPPPS